MATCMLCGASTNDELKFGELLTIENVTVHYFCLVISKIFILLKISLFSFLF